jgi:hypothetical protein
MISDEKLEAAVRAFLKVIRPSMADAPMATLNAVGLNDTDYKIVDAIRAALEAADRV